MGGVESAGAIIQSAMQRIDVAAQNLANLTTPGYKAKKAFSSFLTSDQLYSAETASDRPQSVDMSAGKLRSTGNPLDLAISGQGFFVVKGANGTVYYTRDGQFARDAQGTLVTADGLMLQSSAGDTAVSGTGIQVLEDGTLLDGGEPVARLSIAQFADPTALKPVGNGLFSAVAAPQDMASPVIRQGMLETSNVSGADEMISMMAALRSAQAGQQMVQVYDELTDRAASAFGQTS